MMKLFGGSGTKEAKVLTTGEVGREAKLPELQKIEGKSEIKPTDGFLGRLLAKREASTTNTEKTSQIESKATENANPELNIETTKSSNESPKLLSFSELPTNLQKSLKFLSPKNKEDIQAVKVKSENPDVDNYLIMFTGKAAKQLFLNTFQKILHGMNLFGKSNAPDQADTLLTESNRNQAYLSQALKNNSAYLQAQFTVPVNVKQKAEIKEISVTESPFNLQKLLIERKDLQLVVLNAAKQIITEKPDISIRADLEVMIKALETKDKEALKKAFEPFARTYSLEELKTSPEANKTENSLVEDSATALTSQGISKDGLDPTIVISGTEIKSKKPDAIAITDLLLPTENGKFNSGELTIIDKKDTNNNIAQLIFYIIPTMAELARAGKTLNKDDSKALTEAMVKSTINADLQAKAAVAQLN